MFGNIMKRTFDHSASFSENLEYSLIIYLYVGDREIKLGSKRKTELLFQMLIKIMLVDEYYQRTK